MASRLCNSSARAGPWLAIHWEMQTMSDPDPQVVLIVGAGPAGLFAACELVRHGIKPRIVERRSGPHHEARGTALHRRCWRASSGRA